jgi:hypothetical protein
MLLSATNVSAAGGCPSRYCDQPLRAIATTGR